MDLEAEIGTHTGRLSFADDRTSATRAMLLVTADTIALDVGSHRVGDWPRSEVAVTWLSDTAHLRVESEHLVFTPDQPGLPDELPEQTGLARRLQLAGTEDARSVPGTPPPDSEASAALASSPSRGSAMRRLGYWYGTRPLLMRVALGAVVFLISGWGLTMATKDLTSPPSAPTASTSASASDATRLEKEALYLEMLREQASNEVPSLLDAQGDDLVRLGWEYCAALDRGLSPEQVGMAMFDSAESLGTFSTGANVAAIGVITGTALGLFCPHHMP